MKTPLSYYGGKQKLVSTILPLIPTHNLYAEPFVGGGAVFWAKDKSNVEVINDTNRELINFYQVVQRDFVSLEREVRISLHSRSMHKDAQVINSAPHMFNEVKRAWAIWVLATQSFASGLDKAWGYDIQKNTTSKKIQNKKDSFTEDLAIRLQGVQIESTDAIRIIEMRDRPDSFFYCDPPYVGSDCGHYDGYTQTDFDGLLSILSKIKGKFLLSSYPNKALTECIKAYGWHHIQIQGTVSVANNTGKPQKAKTECLTANYPIQIQR
ncbi:MAG: DNA adenine methylase [Flavobacteriales bacterium]|nr:DNA adenine methylase [Flavobacteriales bacterium]